MNKYPPGFPWVATFRKYSWWFSPAKGRLFVIVQVWHKDDGSVESLELLEQKNEMPVQVDIKEMIDWLNNGQLQPISSMPV